MRVALAIFLISFLSLVVTNAKAAVTGNINTDTTVSGGRLLATYVVAKGQSALVDLRELSVRQPPTLLFTITGQMTSGSAADLTAAYTWYEDI